MKILVGGYGSPRGSALGITLLEHDRGAGTVHSHGLMAAAPSVSFITTNTDGTVIYGVAELPQGQVLAYRWTPDGAGLEQMSQQPTEGADPCHLVLHPSGRFLFTANYSSGEVTVHPVRADGTIAPLSNRVRLQGSGPHPERQLSAHPHMISVIGAGAQIVVADLGSDRVWIFGFDPAYGALSLQDVWFDAPSGSGPRQIVFNKAEDRAYLLCELDGSLISTTWPPRGRGGFETTRASSCDPPLHNQPATLIWLDQDRRLLASHRGADVVTSISTQGAIAAPLSDSPSGGRGPRHISLSHAHLYVANELSGNVAVATRKDDAGTFQIETSVTLPSPSCVLVTDPHRRGT